MGMIAKRRTKKIVAPYRVVTSTDHDNVLDYVEQLIASIPAKTGLLDKGEQYFAFERTGVRCNIAYGKLRTPSSRNPADRKYYWTGAILAEPADQGHCLVTVKLSSWRTTDDDLNYRKPYTRFRETFVQGLRNSDPNIQLLDEGN